MINHFNAVMISITATMVLAMIVMVNNGANSEATVPENSFSAYTNTKLPELDYYKDYQTLRADEKTVVIYPIFTQSAYQWKGIHDFYTGRCNSCITAQIDDTYERVFAASGNGFRILEFLGYQVIDDTDVDKHPEILKKFDKVILLHNQFVTKKEFDAITNHPKVIYLYPDSMSSQITTDYDNDKITLVRGSGYPDLNTKDGFGWEYANGQYFNDWECKSWNFYKVSNGYMLNCYPETFLPNGGSDLLKTLKAL